MSVVWIKEFSSMANKRRRLAAGILAAFVICLAVFAPVYAIGEQTARVRAESQGERVAGDLRARDGGFL